MTHHLILGKDCFPLAYEGTKEYEVRPYINEFQNFNDNDTINIEDELTGFFYTAIITRVNYFSNLDEALEIYNYKKIFPECYNQEHAKELIRSRNDFKIHELNHGLIIFKINRISEIVE